MNKILSLLLLTAVVIAATPHARVVKGYFMVRPLVDCNN